MPTFVVTFDQPVVDQPEHPRARRQVTKLPVHAPTAKDAEMHAIRTTVGPGHVISVEEVAETPYAS